MFTPIHPHPIVRDKNRREGETSDTIFDVIGKEGIYEEKVSGNGMEEKVWCEYIKTRPKIGMRNSYLLSGFHWIM